VITTETRRHGVGGRDEQDDTKGGFWPRWILQCAALTLFYPLSLGPVWLASDLALIPEPIVSWLFYDGVYRPLIVYLVDPDGGDLNKLYLHSISWWRSFAGMG
jgi:hypothetical protein